MVTFGKRVLTDVPPGGKEVVVRRLISDIGIAVAQCNVAIAYDNIGWLGHG